MPSGPGLLCCAGEFQKGMEKSKFAGCGGEEGLGNEQDLI